VSMSQADTELAKLFDDTCRRQSLSVVIALLEIELDRARVDQRQANSRVAAVRKQLRRVRALHTKATASVNEWFPS
jgi:hypothetical protein